MSGTPTKLDTNIQTEGTVPTEPQAVDWEKRYKDTQKAYTKSQQNLKKTEAEISTLKDLALSNVKLSNEQVEELEDLKYSDPDAWRTKLNSYETQAQNEFNSRVNEATTKAGSEASIQFELSRREKVLDEFNANSATPLTDEQLANDIPPRLTKQLENGEITFEELLTKAHEYIHTPKKVKNTDDTLKQPSLNGQGSYSGDTKPEETASKKYINSVY
jgi:hypothetical protein